MSKYHCNDIILVNQLGDDVDLFDEVLTPHVAYLGLFEIIEVDLGSALRVP
jgi:hypothetical protein